MTSTAWTYNSTLLSTATADANTMVVRRLIGDVLVGGQQLQDGEINFAVAQYANLYLAAAECSRWLAAQFSREVDLVTGQLKTNYSQKARSYAALAIQLEQRGVSRGAGALPYVGGTSVADKAAQVADTDRVAPQFTLAMDDNLRAGPATTETPDNPSGGQS